MYSYKAYYFVHGYKPYEKIVTICDFNIARIPPDNLLGISAAGTGLISTVPLFSVRFLLPQLEEAKYNSLLILNLVEMRSNMGWIKLKRALRRKTFTSHFHWMGKCRGIDNWVMQDGRERTEGQEHKNYTPLCEASNRRWNRSCVRKRVQGTEDGD